MIWTAFGPGSNDRIPSGEILDQEACMLRLDDGHGGFRLEFFNEGIDKPKTEVFLQHQPSTQSVDESRQSR